MKSKWNISPRPFKRYVNICELSSISGNLQRVLETKQSLDLYEDETSILFLFKDHKETVIEKKGDSNLFSILHLRQGATTVFSI